MQHPLQHAPLLLSRILNLKDVSPLVLLLDTPKQTAKYFLLEFVERNKEGSVHGLQIVYLSFETIAGSLDWIGCPSLQFVSCHGLSHQRIHEKVNSLLRADQRSLILIDSLADIPAVNLVEFITPLIRPSSTLVAISHLALSGFTVIPTQSYAPSAQTLLLYIATTIIKLLPRPEIDKDEENEAYSTFLLPLGSNSPQCRLEFLHRRKSGRAVQGNFNFDFTTHNLTFIPPSTASDSSESREQGDDALLKDLTTFNLGTTEKQRIARDKVELPYLSAQEGDMTGTAAGGAIVYQFETDDDYDEEDPYEDPF
ncbi:Elongator complex protein 5 [Lipomyces kononenkoae]|uniref:Elongator complex protein 5 n=1 Tax=Lipomyces kononenkoae TaxID=34357 RepID=A0ACC3T636_LIPKO